MNVTIISIAAAGGVTGLFVALYILFRDHGNSSIEDRLDVFAGKKVVGEGTQVTKEALLQEGMDGLAGVVTRLMERFGNVKLLFIQADSPIKPEVFFIISVLCAGLGVAGCVAGRSPVPLYPVTGLVTGSLPLMWMLWRRGRRFKKFSQQLPDALALIARALRSGNSLAAAMRVVVDEMPDPISHEFQMAYEEQNLGFPVEQALRNTYKRMPNMDFKFFATAVAIQRTAGGDLAEILDKISGIVRARFKILGQVQALTGEGRISGVVLMGLPIALFFAVWHLNSEYVMLLFTDELGRKMVGVAAVLQILGAVTIKKIVAIKV